MRNGTLLALLAFLVSLVGVAIALAVYFQRRRWDDLDECFDEDFFEEELDCGCGCGDQELPADMAQQAQDENI